MSISGKFLQHSWAGKLVPGPLADIISGGTQGTGPRLKCGSHNLGLQLAAEMKKIGRGICLFVCPVLFFFFFYPKAISAGTLWIQVIRRYRTMATGTMCGPALLN